MQVGAKSRRVLNLTHDGGLSHSGHWHQRQLRRRQRSLSIPLLLALLLNCHEVTIKSFLEKFESQPSGDVEDRVRDMMLDEPGPPQKKYVDQLVRCH